MSIGTQENRLERVRERNEALRYGTCPKCQSSKGDRWDKGGGGTIRQSEEGTVFISVSHRKVTLFEFKCLLSSYFESRTELVTETVDGEYQHGADILVWEAVGMKGVYEKIGTYKLEVSVPGK